MPYEARWKTQSTPRKAFPTSSFFLTSPATQRTPAPSSWSDQGEEARRSRERTSRAPRRSSSRHSAEPTKPWPPVTANRTPSIPSFSLRCISDS
ncbi:Os02g0715225, partial [Oryza sativa Japonica Group]